LVVHLTKAVNVNNPFTTDQITQV